MASDRIFPIPSFSGVEVVVTTLLPTFHYKQNRFPRSKKKRIRNKWAKDMRNFVKVSNGDDFYRLDGKVLASARGYQMLRDQFGGNNGE
jgi:hypothetical protein